MLPVRIFVVSDHHFGHQNMYKFVSFDGTTRVRPHWDDCLDADRMMVELHNSVVTAQDHVYFLGDVAMSSWALQRVHAMNGHKRLVLGNHDKEDVKKYREVFQKVMASRFIDGCILSHIPLHPESVGERVNVHGHIHERAPYGPQYRNVSVERIAYKPRLLSEVREGLWGTEKVAVMGS